MADSRRKVLLLDGTGLVYRAYFAFITRPMTTSRGENTSAIFGFFRILIMIIRDFKPDLVVTAFDLSRKTFRNDLYPDYKAHRDETPPELKLQIPLVIDLLKLMKLPIIELEGFEADDIIGTLAEKMKAKDDVFIVSSDKDLLQLVDDTVKAVRPQNGINEINLTDRAGVKAVMGVTPEQIPDYLAIVGDSSDNIPGVKGIGEKGAVQLLTSYKDLDDIYAHIDDIKGAMQKKLIESKENAYLSKLLAQIRLDVPVDMDGIPLKIDLEQLSNPDVAARLTHYQLASVLNDLKKLLNGNVPESKPAAAESSLFGSEAAPAAPASYNLKGDYHCISTKKELTALEEAIRVKKLIAVDVETTSSRAVDSELIGLSVSIDEGEGVFIPAIYPAGQEFDGAFVMEALRPVLEDPSVRKIGHDLKFVMEVLYYQGVKMAGAYFDTMIAAYLLNSVRMRNSLEDLVSEYLGIHKISYKDILKGVLKKDKTLLDAALKDLTDYACGNSDVIFRLKNRLEPLIRQNKLEEVFYSLEMPLIPVLAVVEQNGVKIDTKRLASMSKELDGLMKELEEKIYRLAGHTFNINSPAQLGRVLFEELKLDPVKKTDSGKPSTDEEVLTALAFVHPLPDEILRYRTYSKLKGTYIDALPELIAKRTGRIHTSFNQTVAATGRLSSTDPNLQNIPVREEVGHKIREAFIVEEGNVMISADYSQIELRVLAHFCGDEAMRYAFSSNLDIHSHTAALIFGVAESEVTDEMRRRAKSVNFGIIYGLQAYGLSRQLGISMTEAKDFIAAYFANFPKVKGFVESLLTDVTKTGEVRTISGRYRRFPDLVGKELKGTDHLSASQRMALNGKMQGSAADIIKMAMVRLQQYIEKEGLQSKLILQIHDELLVEAPESEAETMKKAMKETMEHAYELTVPLVVEVGSGRNWREAH